MHKIGQRYNSSKIRISGSRTPRTDPTRASTNHCISVRPAAYANSEYVPNIKNDTTTIPRLGTQGTTFLS